MLKRSLQRLARSIAQPRRHRFAVVPLAGLGRDAVFDRRTKKWTILRVRPGSDRDVVAQVFHTESYGMDGLSRGQDVRDRYERLVREGRQPLVVDCGANIGASAAYFSICYPAARIVAIEPSGGNLAQAHKNCRSANVEFVAAAVASRPGRSSLIDPGWGSWSLRVRETHDGEIPMVTIQSIVSSDQYRTCEPFIVKIDIEGFEDDVFADNLEWIDQFPVIMIELHDWLFPGEAKSRAFLEAMGVRDRDFVVSGETIFSVANG
jgi:FkbM family methyltransferase